MRITTIARGFLRRLTRRRYPVVRQYDQVDCGPAALLSVLRYWGGDTSLVRARELARTDAHGSTMLSLVRAAEALGFRARGATGEYEDLAREQMPCIAHMVMPGGLQHFVVVYEVRPRSVRIGDPAQGLRVLSREAFLALWSQRAVVLLTPASPLTSERVLHWTAWVAGYFRQETTWLSQSVFLGVVYTALWLLTSLFVKWLVDDFIPHANLRGVALTAAFLLLLQALRAGVGFLRQRFLIGLSQRSNVAMARDFLHHVYRLPSKFFDTRKRGDITARINDSIQIQAAVVRIVGLTVVDVLIVAGAVVSTFVIAPEIGWLALATLPLYGMLLARVTRPMRAAQNDVARRRADVESTYIDTLGGIDDIRGFYIAEPFAKAADDLYRAFQDRAAALGRLNARASLFAELIGGGLVIAALALGAWAVVGGTLPLGAMLAAYSLLASALPSVGRIVDANAAFQSAAIAAMRLNDLLLVEPERANGGQPFRMRHALRLERATFAWPRDRALFDDVSMSIERGRITALRGPSGSGKSTIVKLLQRGYPLAGGELWVDEVPASAVALDSYRANVAVLRESTKIFNLTLGANITLGRGEGAFEPDRLRQFIGTLGFGPFLERFHAGLLTLVGEEARQLSSGERQIVGLLRALLREPAVLVVDEGINAVDASLAPLVHQALLAYAGEHAVLLISHDSRTVSMADVVYTLRDGRAQREAGRDPALWRKTG